MVVTLIFGVLNEVPVPKDVPPVATLYHLIVPAETVAFNVTEPASHLEAGVTEDTTGIVNIVAATAVLPDSQLVVEADT